jgi:hypothetical protein
VRVEVEHVGRVGCEQESVVDRPLADRVAATAQDGDVERVDLGLLEHLGVRDCTGSSLRERSPRDRGSDLLFEALQRPVAAALDLRRDPGQRHDRADRLAGPAELEAGHVALDAVVVSGERGRAGELDGAVLADQAAARDRRRGGERHRDERERDEAEDSTHGFPPSI